jgi:hypothetical protein
VDRIAWQQQLFFKMKFCCLPERLAEKYLSRKRREISRTLLLLNCLIYHDDNGQPFELSIMQNENAENDSRNFCCPDKCFSLDLPFGIYWGPLGSKYSPFVYFWQESETNENLLFKFRTKKYFVLLFVE